MSDNDSRDEQDEQQDEHIRPFADFLVELRHGAVHDELSRTLHDLISAVQTTGKPGAISFTIKASMQKRTEMLVIADSIGKKLPALERPDSLYFVDGSGNPTRSDPTQLAFESIRIVPTGEAKHA